MSDDIKNDNPEDLASDNSNDDAPKGERIAKALARAGVGSRRAVERMIATGIVKIGNQTVTTPATLVTTVENITIDGIAIKKAEPTALWIYHKPAGRLTTYFDPDGRPTVFEALPENMPRVLAVGRLDINTEGLLLLTNDGGLARWLELPAHGFVRTYKVRVNGRFHHRHLEQISRGVMIDGVEYRPVEIKFDDRKTGENQWLTIAITEGKNREVRKLLEYAGLTVTRLIRLDYGPFGLGKIQRGSVQQVDAKKLMQLLPDYFKSIHVEIPEEIATPRQKMGKGWAKNKERPKGKQNPRRDNKRIIGKKMEEEKELTKNTRRSSTNRSNIRPKTDTRSDARGRAETQGRDAKDSRSSSKNNTVRGNNAAHSEQRDTRNAAGRGGSANKKAPKRGNR
jgi:23S rRNA pseudouridine2605 synthase